MYNRVFKRVIDLIVAFIALLILAPLIGLVTLLLYSQNKGKPFFFQERPGQFKKPFYIIKFKTMTDEKDAEGNSKKNEGVIFEICGELKGHPYRG